MTEVRFLPPAAKYIKKLKDKKLNFVNQEPVRKIRPDNTIGGGSYTQVPVPPRRIG